MQVRVKSLQGDEYLIQVQNEQTVYQLKASISEKANGLPVERQKLVFKGRTMQDTSLVSEYNLEEDCKVHLIVQKERETSSFGQEAINKSANPTTCQADFDQSRSGLSDSSALRNNEEMIRMLGQWGTSMGASASSQQGANDMSTSHKIQSNDNSTHRGNHQPQSRLEMILRERLAAHFPSGSIDRIMDNLYKEIDADVNSSSLDDLERLAKQKLNISNE